MRRYQRDIEELSIEIPFYSFIDGDIELMNELLNNYINNTNNIERIKRFMITDYLTQLNNDELAKLFKNFKSQKTKELEEEKKEENNKIYNGYNDDFPF
ncbi:hypothetical protein [Clostridium celatum]|uniref:hypothetical protein n=1 Tax=Clostridium celatum TaxID=36834 RepID=UPI00319DB9CE